MEAQLKKLKTKTVITLILALLAITWQFLNYVTVKDFVPMDNFTSIEVIIIYSSYIFTGILFIALFSLAYTVFRVSMKYHAELKKKEKNQQSESVKIDNSATNTEL